MHKTEMYENLRDMLEKEVKEIEKKDEITVHSLDILYKLMCTIKNIDKCLDREKGEPMTRGASRENRYSDSEVRKPMNTGIAGNRE